MALLLDGINQFGTVTGYKGISGSNNRSISFWFKTTATANVKVVGWGTNAGLQIWDLYHFETAGTFIFQVGIDGGNKLWNCVGYNDGAWHHGVCILDGTKTSDLILYIDKNLMPQRSVNDQTINTGATADVLWGKYPWGGLYYDGSFFDCRIYSEALTVPQLTDIFDEQGCDSVNGNLETKHVFWPEAGICVVEPDVSGNGRTLDASNAPVYVADPFAPCPVVIPIVPTSYTDKKPKVLVLNSGIDLYALGYVLKLNKIQEKKTFQRDKVTTNQMIIPVHNLDDQFNPDNPSAIFAGIPWRYQPVRVFDEDENKIWDGILDDFKDDQNGKKTGIITKDSLLKFFQTKIEYQSADWETPGDSFRNICDAYGYTNYNTKYLEDSIAQYISNDCYIMCNFNISDNVTFQQAIEKIAKFGAADCYSANNYLNFKLYIPFTGGVKFNLQQSNLRKNIKSNLSRAYFNNYIIGYSGNLDIPTTDEDNNNIGLKSRIDNGNHDLILDGSDNQQIVIKDKTSAIFLGETHIRRSHINLSTLPFPPLIITFSLSYDHKDFINLQTWFRMTNVSKGWDDKLFEVYINERDYSNRLINITAYEVDESG